MPDVTLGPKYAVRLGDLQPRHVLRVTCFNCRHAAHVSPLPLLARFGQNQRVADLEDRFACVECGNRFGNSVKVHELIGRT